MNPGLFCKPLRYPSQRQVLFNPIVFVLSEANGRVHCTTSPSHGFGSSDGPLSQKQEFNRMLEGVLALFPVQSLAVVLALFPVQSLALVNVSATLPMGRLSQYFTGLCFVGPFVRLLICCSLIERQS